MRKPIGINTIYKDGETILKRQIEQCFLSDKGPGAIPVINKKKHEIIGAIIPHGDYDYAGPCMAWAYSALAETETPDVYVIISSNHNSLSSGITKETFETPLGLVRVDQKLASAIIEKGTIQLDDNIHAEDVAIEAQLPFLQYLHSKAPERLRILPVLVSSDIDLKILTIDIKESLMDQDKKAVFIVSSNLTQYGSKYHYAPFTDDVGEKIEAQDIGIIDTIKTRDPAVFLGFLNERHIPVDGAMAIAFLMRYFEDSEYNVAVENHYLSGDLTGKYNPSISFASILFKR